LCVLARSGPQTGGHFFFDALIFAQRALAASEMALRPAALILRRYFRGVAAAAAELAAPASLANWACRRSICFFTATMR
jgi:hypothetical protein